MSNKENNRIEEMEEKKLKEILKKTQTPNVNKEAKSKAMLAAMDNFEKNKKTSKGFSNSERQIGKSSIFEPFIKIMTEFKMKNNNKDINYGFRKGFALASVLTVGVFAAIQVSEDKIDYIKSTEKELQNSTSLSQNTENRIDFVSIKEEAKTVERSRKAPEQIVSLDEETGELPISADIASGRAPVSPPPVPPVPSYSMDAGSSVQGSSVASQGLSDIASQTAGSALGKIASKAKAKKVAFRENVAGQRVAEPSNYYAGDIYHQPIETKVTNDKFEQFESNDFKSTSSEPVSTFSIDVDTSSYSFVRKSLNNGYIPQKNSIRIEEMVNYFNYDYPLAESKETPFKPTVAVYQTPWNEDTKLMHIGIKGYDIDKSEKPRANLVFLIDTSGSMHSQDKLPLLKNAFTMLINTLHADDTIAIATYAGSSGVALEPTKVAEKEKILSALNSLHSGGSTAGHAGIKTAYDLAKKNFDSDAVNRVILATDGDFNVGISNPDDLKKYIEKKRNSGVFLSVLGFGQGNYNDHIMQKLAQNGNGNAAYIDSLNEARKVLVEEAGSTLFTIAKDVKIQMEFNPNKISEYKLLGYETRALKREDFNNDKVDAGDIGAGHTVTAIYEIVTTDSNYKSVDPLRYQQEAKKEIVADENFSGEYAFLKIRYKLPNESKSNLITQPIDPSLEKADVSKVNSEFKFASSVVAFSKALRGDLDRDEFSFKDIIKLAEESKGNDKSGYRQEFINLVKNSEYLIPKE